MDVQTHNLRFETMRRAPSRGASNHKALVMAHRDLEKRCDVTKRKHENDSRYFAAGYRHQKQMLERRHEVLSREKERISTSSRKNHAMLDRQQRVHVYRERTFQQTIARTDLEPNYIDVLKEIMKLSMPTRMKQRIVGTPSYLLNRKEQIY